jgi:Tfp pilus assembly protein PilF
MEQQLRQDPLDVELARRMAAVMGKDEQPERKRFVYERIVALDPFDADAHAALGRMALGQADAAGALREFKAAFAAGPNDPAAARCDLAEAYLLAGDPAQAKKQTLLALEQTPTYERAQELLLKIVEGGR